MFPSTALESAGEADPGQGLAEGDAADDIADTPGVEWAKYEAARVRQDWLSFAIHRTEICRTIFLDTGDRLFPFRTILSIRLSHN